MAVRIESQAEPIPGYKLIKRLGGGGFGEVWKAEAPGGLHKAIKFVYGNLQVEDDATRAEQELRALSRVKEVRHPYILSIERYDIIDGQLLIVMELADRDLWDRFTEARRQGLPGIPRPELLSYMREAAEALDLMNMQYELQHLDIKPQNLFLIHNHVKVADFGLVKDMEGKVATITGGVTPVYAAPETFEGQISAYCDQYSLAIVFQELLTGVRPFAGTNPRQLILQHIQAKPNVEPLPEGDRAIVSRALAKTPEDRYPSCMEMVRELEMSDRPVLGAVPAETSAAAARPAQPALTPAFPQHIVNPFQTRAGSKSTGTAPPAPQTPGWQASTPGPAQMATPARDERTGDGVLFPALVIGLGQTGIGVLQLFRREVINRFGDPAQLRHIRSVCIETDPELVNHRLFGAPDVLAPDEMILARLFDKPSRYLNNRPHELPPVESWLNVGMIYRIDRRNPVTNGIRSLGRLAFLSNYRGIVARLRKEIEQITSREAIDRGLKQTGQALRSDWPRIYIVTSLADGSGSGMFLDVAYNVRAILREMGFSRQEIVGLLVAPPEDPAPNAALALANTYASLVELNHFSAPGETFLAQYDTRILPLQEAGPAFTRAVLMPLANRSEEAAEQLGRLSARYLYRDILTSLGKAVDYAREQEMGRPPGGLLFSSFGLNVLSSPRRQMIRQLGVARRLCRIIAERWSGKSAPGLGGQIGQQVLDQLMEKQCDPQSVIEALHAASSHECQRQMDQGPEDLFIKWAAPIKSMAAPAVPDSIAVNAVLQQIDELLGPNEDEPKWRPGRPPLVPATARETCEQLFRKAAPFLHSLIVGYLDRPGYRMGAAEEAIEQLIKLLEGWLKRYEQHAEELTRKVDELRTLLQATLTECDRCGGRMKGWRRDQLMKNLGIVLDGYPTLRLQQVLVQCVIRFGITLRGYVSDQKKELGYSRQRLLALLQSIKDLDDGAHVGMRPEEKPHGSLAEAIETEGERLEAEELDKLDQLLQVAVQNRWRGLGQFCTTPGNDIVAEMQTLLLHEVETYVEKQLPQGDVVEVYFDPQQNLGALAEKVTKAYEEAAPLAAASDLPFTVEFGMLAAPDSPAAGGFLQMVARALPEIKTTRNDNRDEIVFYREYVGIPVEDLKQAGLGFREAYVRASSVDQFTPHSRQDVMAWKELSGM